MNKAELIASLVEMTDESKATVEAVLESFEVVVKSRLHKGEDVTVPGLGKFSISSRKARTGRNPKTGDAITIAAKKVATFSAAKGLRYSINL